MNRINKMKLLFLLTVAFALSLPLPAAELFRLDKNTSGVAELLAAGKMELVPTGGEETEFFIESKENGGNRLTIQLPDELLSRMRGKEIAVSAECRQQGVSAPPNSWNGVKLMLIVDEKGKAAQYPGASFQAEDEDWTQHGFRWKCGKELASVKLVIGLEMVRGRLWVRDLKITEAKKVDSGDFQLRVTADHSDFNYRPKEMIGFHGVLKCRNPGKYTEESFRIIAARRGESGSDGSTVLPVADDGSFHFETSLDKPGFVQTTFSLAGKDGVPLGNMQDSNLNFVAGASTESEAIIQAFPEPDDFDEFWKEQLEYLQRVPMEVMQKEFAGSQNGVDFYDVRIACAGRAPVSGYLSIPHDAKPGSLPVKILYDGYGVRSALKIPVATANISLSINAHGIDNGREADYYGSLRNGELRNYGLSAVNDPAKSYFRDMLLRAVRALEYARSLPEWNGRDLSVGGGSQGGFQALAVAALRPDDVTACNVNVPWMGNQGGARAGRANGFYPAFTPAILYYDSINFAKRIKCPVRIEMGLGDTTCPPSAVTAIYNALNAPKWMRMTQGKTHNYTPSGASAAIRSTPNNP